MVVIVAVCVGFAFALLIVILCILAETIQNVRTEPCCPRGKGCNESGYVANRKCEHVEAMREAESWERPALEDVWEHVQRTPRWVLHEFKPVRDDYLATQRRVRAHARARDTHGKELTGED